MPSSRRRRNSAAASPSSPTWMRADRVTENQSEETMKRIVMAALAVAAMMGASHVANADALDDIKKSGKIRIAIDLGVPPYGMTDAQMKPTGLDVEAAEMLAKDWGLKFEHVSTTGASRIPALQTGKADLVISSLSYTAER